MQKKLSQREDRNWLLGHEKIGSLLLRLSAPAMVGMMVQSMYNLVDTYFVGRGVGVLAIGGIAISFPVQIIILALVQTIGIGSASIISRSLGENNVKRAEQTLGNVVTLIFIIGIAAAAFGMVFIDDVVVLFGADESIAGYAGDYLSIILFGTVFLSFAMSHNNIVRAEGNAKVAMITMIISGVLNIILDANFIMGFGWGVKGAAFATVLSQISTALYLLYYFFSGKSLVLYRIKYLRLKKSIVKEMLAVGSPAFVRMGAGSVGIIILNKSLAHYGGALSIAAFGIIHRLIMFTFMPMFGIVQGFQPIVGFNYGAQKFDRVQKVIKLAIIVTTIWSTVTFFVLLLFPQFLLGMFTANPQSQFLELGTGAIRKIILIYPFVGFMIIVTGLFQSLGKALPAVILALSRQVLLLIPAMLILPIYFDLNGIWYSFPLADSITLLVATFLFIREMKLLTHSYSNLDFEAVQKIVVEPTASGE